VLRVRTAHLTRARGPLVAALAGLVAWGLGCGNLQPRASRWDDDASAAGSVRVVVAPLNLALRLAPDLEDAVEPVGEEIIRYLQSHGAKVAVIWPPDAWSLWRASMQAIQGSESLTLDLETAARVFVRELTEHADFDLLLMPSLVYRKARVNGRVARWDGVRRKISVRTRTPTGASVVAAEWQGRITALSLHALVFTPEGRRVFQGWGGLDLVHDAVLEREGNPGRAFLRLQRQLLESPEHVREGVALALERDAFTSPR
jgi:hypothetical protein